MGNYEGDRRRERPWWKRSGTIPSPSSPSLLWLFTLLAICRGETLHTDGATSSDSYFGTDPGLSTGSLIETLPDGHVRKINFAEGTLHVRGDDNVTLRPTTTTSVTNNSEDVTTAPLTLVTEPSASELTAPTITNAYPDSTDSTTSEVETSEGTSSNWESISPSLADGMEKIVSTVPVSTTTQTKLPVKSIGAVAATRPFQSGGSRYFGIKPKEEVSNKDEGTTTTTSQPREDKGSIIWGMIGKMAESQSPKPDSFHSEKRLPLLESVRQWWPAKLPPTPASVSSQPQTFDPYKNWESDSQERERELEERGREELSQSATLFLDNGTDAQQGNLTGKWYLLLLSGNSTTVRLRRDDFTKYLRLNLAARLSLEYNDVRVNRVDLSPLVVNVTVVTRRKDAEVASLNNLADTNATLLELSGEEYHMVRFIPAIDSHFSEPAPFADTLSQTEPFISPERHDDVEMAIFTIIAGICAFACLTMCAVLAYRSVKQLTSGVTWSWSRQKPSRFPRWSLPHPERGSGPNVIYSGQFSSVTPSAVQVKPSYRFEQGPGNTHLSPVPPTRLRFVAAPGKAHLAPQSPMGDWPQPVAPNPPAPLVRNVASFPPEILERESSSVTMADTGTPSHRNKLSLFSCGPENVVVATMHPRGQVANTEPLDVRINSDFH